MNLPVIPTSAPAPAARPGVTRAGHRATGADGGFGKALDRAVDDTRPEKDTREPVEKRPASAPHHPVRAARRVAKADPAVSPEGDAPGATDQAVAEPTQVMLPVLPGAALTAAAEAAGAGAVLPVPTPDGSTPSPAPVVEVGKKTPGIVGPPASTRLPHTGRPIPTAPATPPATASAEPTAPPSAEVAPGTAPATATPSGGNTPDGSTDDQPGRTATTPPTKPLKPSSPVENEAPKAGHPIGGAAPTTATAAPSAAPATISPDPTTVDVPAVPAVPVTTATPAADPAASTTTQVTPADQAVVPQVAGAAPVPQVAHTVHVQAPVGHRAADYPTPAQQIAPHVVALATGPDGSHRMTLHLHPEELGSVRVSVEIRDQTVNVSLIGDDDSARDLLRGALSDLRRELADAGLDAGSLDVSTRQPGAGSAGPGADTEQPPRGDRSAAAGRSDHVRSAMDGNHPRTFRRAGSAHPSGTIDVTV